MKTIIFAHPWHGSFNKAILDSVIEKFDGIKEEYTVIDLNKDGFNPVMTEKDLELYSQGKTTDFLVDKYKEILKKSDSLIFIFPIWWGTMPAILKGFIDKVFLRKFAYEHPKEKVGIKGFLTNIQSVKIITTAGSPKFVTRFLLGNPIGLLFSFATLRAVGMKKIKWIHYYLKSKENSKDRKNFLLKVKNFVMK